MSWKLLIRTLTAVTGCIASTVFAQGQLVNIATRGLVQTGNNVMIGGFVIGGNAPQQVAIVATGPSLAAFGITNPLSDPVLTLVRSSDQAVLATNDDWQTGSNPASLQAAGFAPSNQLESGILITLQPGAYTAIVSGFEGAVGVAVVGVYAVGVGGGGGGGSSVAGAYTGSSGAGHTVLGLVTNAGRYFFLHTPPATPWGVTAVDTSPSATIGTGTLNTSTNTSFSGLRFPNANGLVGFGVASTVRLGSLAASFTSGASLNGTFTYLPSGSGTVSTSFIAGSNQAASMSLFPRTWTGKLSYTQGTVGSNYSSPSATITISSQGALSGTVGCFLFPSGPGGSCGIAGTLTARSDLKAYDATFSLLEFDGAQVVSNLRNKSFTGIAYYNEATSRFTMVGVSSDNNLLAFQD